MKWLLAAAIIVGLLYVAGDQVNDLISSGRDSASGLTEPIYGLAETIDQTQARVDATNRKIADLSNRAASMPSVDNSASAYGAAARRDIEALNR